MNIDPAHRDIASLVALAEAVADRAAGHDQDDLARFARQAAHRFQACVLTADPYALAVSRFEIDRMLRDGLAPAAASGSPADPVTAPAPRR